MATQVQYRRGTNAQNAAFTGALAEITVDTTNGTLRVHDGITAGGSNIATVAYVTSQISALSSNSISSGTSNVRVFANGNVVTSVAGTANVLNVTSTGAIITGDLSVTGNATLSGNILGDRIQNGTTIIDIQTANGNANISVAGTSNVAVFASTGVFITGVNSVSGNITGGNLSGTNIVGTLTTAAQTNITSVGTLSALTVTANISGGNLLTGGLISATGAITSGGTGTFVGVSAGGGNVSGANFTTPGLITATGNIIAGNVRTAGLITATGSITTAGDLSLTGNIVDAGALGINTTGGANITINAGAGFIIASSGILNGQANGVGNIGNATGYFNTIFAKATSAQYADLAEMYVSDNNYAPGTVVEFGGTHEITISSTSHSTAVAGIVSTNPRYLMNSAQTGEHVLPVALTGRVPCRVQGPVRKGDVLVASSTPGVAQRIGMNWQPGCVLGKSMQGIDNSEIQTIEVAVGRT
jgi:hypothetical protein